ncbi:MAG: AAA family ATPase [Lachnospiraceae bacterium]|nr:AAA family ATPase [Lachnospiraceae bacterium]
MYLKRKIDNALLEWKNMPDHNPLIVKGARQVGKTESILKFGNENYENVVSINFVEEPKYRMICEDGYKADNVIKNISRIDPDKQFREGHTLIFFDEIQDFPDIATSLKFFKLDGRFDVICSGSLLGISYKRIESNSVGYKTDYEMFSLDFEEFLLAKGYGTETVDEMLSHMKEQTPFSQLEMSVYGELFLDYCILGGMPAVVREYIEKGTFEGTLRMQRQLLEDYREDIRKYAEGMDQTRILNVFNQIPVQLAKDNKKFQISKIAKDARFKDYRGCIEWLESAGLINVCHCLNYPELPLKGNYDETKYKIYFRDSGLLVAMLDDEAQEDLRVNKNLGVYKDALYENIVGEALAKCGYSLYYYKRENSTLEEDFFVRTKKSLLPVEVKATNGLAKSLRTLIRNENYSDIRAGIKLTAGNIGFNDNIYTFPYFCTFLLRRYLAEFHEPEL